jgi:hemerythrin-like metal-binding protein
MDSYIIRWNQGLSIGDDYIDSQHRGFVELIGGVSEYGDSRDRHVLSEVLSYAATHFADEEAYMERIEYPGAPGKSVRAQKINKNPAGLLR